MPFPSVTAGNAPIIHSAEDAMPRERPPSDVAAPKRFRALRAALGTIGLHTWPDVMQRALGPWFGLRAASTATPQVPRPGLQAYMNQYDALVAQIPTRTCSAIGQQLLQRFVDCRAALQEVVACRSAFDKLAADNPDLVRAPTEAGAEAWTKLQIAGTRAAVMIALLRQSLRQQRDIERTLTFGRACSLAILVGAVIVSIAFPPAALICVGLCLGAATNWTGLSIARIFWSDPTFRPSFRAIESWVQNQPAELVEGEKTLRILLPAEHKLMVC